MNKMASFFSQQLSHLFHAAVACGVAGLFIAIASAEIGFPVLAQVGFSIGLVAIIVLLGIGATGLTHLIYRRLQG